MRGMLHKTGKRGGETHAPISSRLFLGRRRIGELGFAIAQSLHIPSLVVNEDAIRAAQRMLWRDMRTIAEPGGAVALAALVQGLYVPTANERIGVVICGGNTDPTESWFAHAA